MLFKRFALHLYFPAAILCFLTVYLFFYTVTQKHVADRARTHTQMTGDYFLAHPSATHFPIRSAEGFVSNLVIHSGIAPPKSTLATDLSVLNNLKAGESCINQSGNNLKGYYHLTNPARFLVITYDPQKASLINNLPLWLLSLLTSVLILIIYIFLLARQKNAHCQQLQQIYKWLQRIAVNPADIKSAPNKTQTFEQIEQQIKLIKQSFQNKQRELTDAKDDLEVRVFRRTEELARSYEELKIESAERIKAEQEAQQHRQQLIEDDKLKTLGILSAGVAHEINNPNSFISVNLPVLKDLIHDLLDAVRQIPAEMRPMAFGAFTPDEMEESILQLIEGALNGSTRIDAIVTSLKRYACEHPSYISKPVNLNEVIHNATPLINSITKGKSGPLQYKLCHDLPLILGDAGKIEQVTINLIQNACNALTSLNDPISVCTGISENNQYVFLEVSDHGSGIPEEIIDKIQDPFFTTRRNEGGTGLGLSICRTIAREHNGELEFTSNPSNGTTVRFYLPVTKETCEHD